MMEGYQADWLAEVPSLHLEERPLSPEQRRVVRTEEGSLGFRACKSGVICESCSDVQRQSHINLSYSRS